MNGFEVVLALCGISIIVALTILCIVLIWYAVRELISNMK